MKNKFLHFLMLLSCTLFISCNPQNNTVPNDGKSGKSHFGQALDSFAKYDLRLTNGFDYSVRQYYESEIVNSKSIQLRVNFENGTRAKKNVNTKKLNEFNYDEQYSLTETITYFRNNQICEYDNGGWRWRTFDETEFLKTNLSSYSITEKYFTNIYETPLQSEIEFIADVPSNYINSVLGSEAAGISQLKFCLVVKNDFSLIKSFSFTYYQQYTNTEINFVSFFGPVEIDFPA